MKQTAVEWLVSKLPQRMLNYLKEEIEQAREMEKQQQDEFAIEFAEWLIEKEREYPNRIIRGKELLEIYKKEKGL